ncbi:MAG: 1,4-dihydroxy-2-naphthoate polyprenyltransferase [Acidimicrobiales bacterium]
MSGASISAGRPPIGSIRRWLIGARPKTLAAATVPVLVGTAAGTLGSPGGVVLWRAICAWVVAVGVQVGTNYANDYSDGLRGSDVERVGPTRLTSSGLASPGQVLCAAVAAFLVAGAAGLALAATVSWWLVPLGFACFASGWLYSGGPRPYGYMGLGELFVFVFFGLVATAGSAYVQHGHVGALSVAAGVPVGLLAVALLEANNLRDVQGDEHSKKRTLAVRLGAQRARWLYVGALGVSFASVGIVAWWRPYALVALGALALAWWPGKAVLDGAQGNQLVSVLGATGKIQLLTGCLLTLGLVL